ncbi:hypothetical protein V6N13_017294 [Hibiscus sabdariffa]
MVSLARFKERLQLWRKNHKDKENFRSLSIYSKEQRYNNCVSGKSPQDNVLKESAGKKLWLWKLVVPVFLGSRGMLKKNISGNFKSVYLFIIGIKSCLIELRQCGEGWEASGENANLAHGLDRVTLLISTIKIEKIEDIIAVEVEHVAANDKKGLGYDDSLMADDSEIDKLRYNSQGHEEFDQHIGEDDLRGIGHVERFPNQETIVKSKPGWAEIRNFGVHNCEHFYYQKGT